MIMAKIKPDTLQFLRDLKANNNREWFHKNKQRYDEAKKNNLEITQQLAIGISAFDKRITVCDPNDYIYRIHRDIRFSPDKTPYKTNLGAYIAPGGRKSELTGYYLHIEPDASIVTGGIYMASPAKMKDVRTNILENADEFLKIVNSKSFKNIYQIDFNDSLKRVPQGFETESNVADYLKLKNICPFHNLNDNEIISENALDKIIEYFAVLHPLLEFFNKGIVKC